MKNTWKHRHCGVVYDYATMTATLGPKNSFTVRFKETLAALVAEANQ